MSIEKELRAIGKKFTHLAFADAPKIRTKSRKHLMAMIEEFRKEAHRRNMIMFQLCNVLADLNKSSETSSPSRQARAPVKCFGQKTG